MFNTIVVAKASMTKNTLLSNLRLLELELLGYSIHNLADFRILVPCQLLHHPDRLFLGNTYEFHAASLKNGHSGTTPKMMLNTLRASSHSESQSPSLVTLMLSGE